jgi:two-component system sensor histidine kinase MprB
MRSRRPLSLRGRVASVVAVTVAIPLLLVGVGLQLASGRALVAAIDRDLSAIAEDLERDRRGMLVMGGPRRERFGGASGIVQLVTADGRIVTGRSMLDARLNPEGIELPVDDRVLAVAQGDREAFLRTVEVEGQPLRVLAAPLGPDLAVQVARPLEEVLTFITELRRRTTAVTLVAVLIATLSAWWVAGRSIRPVTALIDSLEAVRGAGDLTRRVEVRGDDEVARVAIAFNAMLERLEAARKARQQLTADASHELRTPLTSLRTNIEVLMLDGAMGSVDTGDDRRRLLDDVVGQLDELAAMVDGLVTLASVDATEGSLRRVDLTELATEVVATARRRYPQRGHEIELDVPHPLQSERPHDVAPVVLGDRARLTLALANLIDNAVKYAPSGMIRVTIRSDEARGVATLAVTDQGPGVEDADLPQLFEPFYRASAARSSPGAGLGLALVASVAASHQGEVSASGLADGLLVEMVLPIARPASAASDDQSAASAG